MEGHALCPELKVGDLTFFVEMRGAPDGPVQGELLHSRLAAGTASYWTRHVGLVLSARMLDVEMQVDERQDGRVMHVRFVWNERPVHVIAVYGPGTRALRKTFYTDMWIPDTGDTVVVLGDFNTVTCVQRDIRAGGDSANPGGVEWNDKAAAAGLHDTKDLAGATGAHFTWEGMRKWGTPGNVARRLDRIHVTGDVHVENWGTLPPWGTLDHAVVTCTLARDASDPMEDAPARMKESVMDARNTTFFADCQRLVLSRHASVAGPHVPDERKAAMLGEVFSEIQGLYVDHAKAREKAHHAEVKAARRKAKKLAKQDKARGDVGQQTDGRRVSMPGTPPSEPHSQPAGRQGGPSQPGTPPSEPPGLPISKAAQAEAARVHDMVCEAIERLTVEKEDTADAYAMDHDTLGDRDFFRRRLRVNAAVEFRKQRVARLEHDEQVRTAGMAGLGQGGFDDGTDPEDWTTGPDPPPSVTCDAEGMIHDEDDIRRNTMLYYQWRFRKRRDHRPSRRRVLQYAREAPRFNKYAVKALGADVTVKETSLAIKRLRGGRAPGPDGITSECLQGIDAMPAFLCMVFNASYRLGRLPNVLMQGTVVMLHKKGDRSELDNMRPLTLCQRGYLVLANIMTARLEQFMGQVVLEDQTAFVPGRQMFENVCKIGDMLDYTRDVSLPAALVSVDARAAYDCVSHDALFSLLDIACTPAPCGDCTTTSDSDDGVGEEPGPAEPRARFTKWVMLLTQNARRRVLVNGVLSDAFTLEAGVPQGSSLSPALFCVFCNTLGVMLQEQLHGVPLPRAPDEPDVDITVRGRARSSGRRITAVRFADDVNFVVRENELSLAFDIIECWCQGLGMGINAAKSEGMWIGSARERCHCWKSGAGETPSFSVWKGEPRTDAGTTKPRCQWLRPGQPMRILGVAMGYSVDYGAMWRKVGAKMLTAMRLWGRLKLSLPARVMVLKTMVLSKCWFLSMYCPSDEPTLALVRRAGLIFLHRGFLPHGLNVDTPLKDLRVPTAFNFPSVSADLADGGLGFWDPTVQVRVLHAKWIWLLLQPAVTPTGTIASWLHLPRYYMAWHTSRQDCRVRGLGALIDGHKRTLAARLGSVLPSLWQRALKAWIEVRDHAVLAAPSIPEHVPSCHLWDNVLIRGPKGPLEPPPGWMRAGLHVVRDVWCLEGGRPKTHEEVLASVPLASQACVTSEALAAVVQCIPPAWAELLRGSEAAHTLGEWLQMCTPTAACVPPQGADGPNQPAEDNCQPEGGDAPHPPASEDSEVNVGKAAARQILFGFSGWPAGASSTTVLLRHDVYHVAAVRKDGPVYQHYQWSRGRAEWCARGQYAPAALHVEHLRRAQVHIDAKGKLDHVVGLTHDVWAQDAQRLTWDGQTFSTRTVRRMIEPQNPVLALPAGKVADTLRLRPILEAAHERPNGDRAGTVWQVMVQAVWKAVLPPRVRDETWRLLAGAAYFASQRRWHDVHSAVCKHCVRTGDVHWDSAHHAYCECPAWAPLWRWAQDMLRRAGFDGFSSSAFMVYGALAPSNAHHERFVHELYEGHPVMAIRGSMAAGFARARAATNRPPPEGEERPPPPHPVVAARIANGVLKRAIKLDFKEASRQLVHRLPRARADEPIEAKRRRPRPEELLGFETKWMLFAKTKLVLDRGVQRPALVLNEALTLAQR